MIRRSSPSSALLGLAFALALLAGAAVPAAAQSDLPPSPLFDEIETRSYFFDAAGVEMEYELFVPSSYDDSEAHPLVVVLHGLGSSAARVIRYQGLVDLAEERGYLVVAPEGFNSRGWYGSRGWGRTSDRPEASDDPPNTGQLSELDVLNVLAIVQKDFAVDPERIYLMGHSMGGGGTLYLAMKNPDVFDALGPVAPAIYSDPSGIEAVSDVPVIVVMGDADRLVDVEVTREWVAEMEELGMPHEYVEIPDGDHTRIITRSPENMERIFDFFDAAQEGGR